MNKKFQVNWTKIKGDRQSCIKVATHDSMSDLTLVYTLGWLEGAKDGVEFLFDPDWDTVLDPNIWAKAAGQILFSLSVGFGGQLVLSSYNNFKNNSMRDSLLIGLCNSLTSLYAGIVVFLILGFLAQSTGGQIDQVVKGCIFFYHFRIVGYNFFFPTDSHP